MIENVVKKSISVLAEYAGKAAAAYHQRLEKANAEAKAQARYNAAANFCANWLMLFAWLLWESIKATNELTGLLVPIDPDGLLVDQPFREHKSGVPCLVFSGWSKLGYNMPVKQIQAQLNTELRRLCLLHGIPRIVVVAVRRFENRRVCFVVALADDVQAARQAIKAAEQEKNKNGPIQI